MIINYQVPLHRLVLSLSQAIDHVHPAVADHQQRVAYMSLRVAQELGLPRKDQLTLFLAAAFHDIGLIRDDQKMKVRTSGLAEVAGHGEAGYLLLRDNPLFASAADIVREHHLDWDNGRGAVCQGREVPLAAHIINLADTVERAIDRREPILEQAESLTQLVLGQSETAFHPDCVAAFHAASRAEAFWLDTASEHIYSRLLARHDWPQITLDERTIEPIARMFGRIVDAASPWTATHSAGVTASAVELARRFGFSPRELGLMRAAGYFHDLGKLAVPSAILDKPGDLTPQERRVIKIHSYHTFHILNTIGGMPQICEWAAFHHERLDGHGYPFGHAGKELTLGARIMAVADVFTALAEDRPYRPALEQDRVFSILDNLVTSGGLDPDVVAVLARNCHDINETRRQAQAAYAREQEQLFETMNALKPVGAA